MWTIKLIDIMTMFQTGRYMVVSPILTKNSGFGWRWRFSPEDSSPAEKEFLLPSTTIIRFYFWWGTRFHVTLWHWSVRVLRGFKCSINNALACLIHNCPIDVICSGRNIGKQNGLDHEVFYGSVFLLPSPGPVLGLQFRNIRVRRQFSSHLASGPTV